MSVKNVGLALGFAVLSTVAFGQKNNVTNAALEYRDFAPFYIDIMTGAIQSANDIEKYKKPLLSAKKEIDIAIEHPNLKDDPKTDQKAHWYNGEIYAGLIIISSFDSTATDIDADKAFETSLNSYKYGYTVGNKYKQDIKDAALQKRDFYNTMAGMAYGMEQFAEAAEAYDVAWQFSEAVSIIDTALMYNAGLCYEKSEKFEKAGELYGKLAKLKYRGTASAVMASQAYRNAEMPEKAEAVILEAQKDNPSDRELLMELVAIKIDSGDNEGAEKALNDAIAADPNNKILYYNIGTIYMNMENNEKAENNLRKALEIDPNYVDAQYQLGAHLFNWALQLKDEASFMKIGDPRIGELEALGDEKMDGAVEALENYIKSDPNNKSVLKILYKAYHKKGNAEKAKEYKARYEAL